MLEGLDVQLFSLSVGSWTRSAGVVLAFRTSITFVLAGSTLVDESRPACYQAWALFFLRVVHLHWLNTVPSGCRFDLPRVVFFSVRFLKNGKFDNGLLVSELLPIDCQRPLLSITGTKPAALPLRLPGISEKHSEAQTDTGEG